MDSRSLTLQSKLVSLLTQSRWGPLILIWAVGSLVYGQALGFDYVFFDDHYLIVEQQHFLQKFSNVVAVFADDVFRSNYDSYYRPLLTLSFMIDASVGGPDPFIYHLTNILLHLTCSTLVWILFKRLQLPRTTALLLALLFTVHPAHAQSNYWIPGRNDPLMGTFALASSIALLSYLRGPSKKGYALHALFWFLAILSKETALFLVPVWILYGYLFAIEKRPLLRLMPAWILGAAIWEFLKSMAFENPIPLRPEIMLTSLFQAWPALIHSVGKAVIPVNLAALPTIQDTTLAYGLLSVSFIIWLVYKNPSRDMKTIVFGMGWFFFLLIPTFIRTEIQTEPYFLETRLYLPIVGMLIFVSQSRWGQSILKSKKNASIYATVLILFSAINVAHGRKFKDRLTFWQSAVASSPSLPMAFQNLGAIYLLEGDLDRAESVIKEAIARRPLSPLAYNNLGVIYMTRGQPGLAEQAFKRSLQIDPRYDDAGYLLGLLYYDTRQTDKAKKTWERTLKINPYHPQTLARLALLAHASHEEERLREYIRRLRMINYPLPEPIRHLGLKTPKP